VNLLGWSLLVVLVAGLAIWAIRAARGRALAGLRRAWGTVQPRSHKLDEIHASHRSRATELGVTGLLDDRTWNDLLLDDVFAGLDRTESTLGQHALYHRLRTTPTTAERAAFSALVNRFTQHAVDRERAQLALTRLRDPHGYNLWWLARPDAVDVPSWFAAFPALAATTLTLLALLPWYPALGPTLLLVVVVNVASHYAILNRLSSATGAFRQLAPIIATGQALRFLQGEDINRLVATLGRNAPRLRRLKAISRTVSGDPFMLSVNPHPLALIAGDAVNVFFDYLNLALPLTATGLYVGAGDLRASGRALLDVIAAIGDIDAAVSVASLRASRSDWTSPAFLPAGTPAVVTDARHPLVTDAVPNSITLPPAAGVLVTGSNMSGKSTFLRTIGVTAVLAQTIDTCFATEYRAPVFRVRSCIGRADDLLTGRSYYLVEVESLLELVRDSDSADPHLFLLDELFRGTNAVERIAAGQAVLMELVGAPDGSKPHVAIAATHDSELVDLLSGSYVPCHFGDAISDQELTFTYRLQPGRATSRNAIALLRLHGAPPALVERALVTAVTLDARATSSVVPGGAIPRTSS
jgi:hypothetical protein